MVVVSDGPTASFTAAPTGLSVAFTDTSTNAGGATYSWDFGDGGSASVADPNHPYAAPNTYLVTLTVTVGGLSDTVMQSVAVP